MFDKKAALLLAIQGGSVAHVNWGIGEFITFNGDDFIDERFQPVEIIGMEKENWYEYIDLKLLKANANITLDLLYGDNKKETSIYKYIEALERYVED